jgi:predicted porin
MKKLLTTLAALAACTAAIADSSVTLWGVVDLGVAHTSATTSSTYMANGNVAGANKLGFKGVEDLGGGTWSAFYLESGFNGNSGEGQGSGGGLNFNRRSSVSLGGQWGELRVGRDFNVSFENYVLGDPFGDSGIAAGGDHLTYANAGTNAKTDYFVNNAVKYAYGFKRNDSTWGFGANGFYAEVQTALAGNATGTPANGQYTGLRAGYGAGPFNGAVSYATSKGLNQAGTAGSSINYKEFNYAVSYDLGSVNLMSNGGINNSDTPGTKFEHLSVGAQIPVGAGSIPVALNTVRQVGLSGGSASMAAIGYIYNLSKRTSVYGIVAHTSNGSKTNYGPGGGEVALGASATGFVLGVKSDF